VQVEAPHPRAQATGVAPRIDGRVLESVRAVGKNLLLGFDGGVLVRSHLRMSGRWRVEPRGTTRTGKPWLVLRGDALEGVLWNGPVLTLDARAVERLGPDVLGDDVDVPAVVARLRSAGARPLGEALQDQRLVAGIGNMWMAESLWRAGISPWLRLRDVPEGERRRALETAAGLMRAAVDAGREPRKRVHGHAGRPCPRCGTRVRSRGQGDANRTVYWCPACQVGDDPPAA
jgi:endonuclease-8